MEHFDAKALLRENATNLQILRGNTAASFSTVTPASSIVRFPSVHNASSWAQTCDVAHAVRFRDTVTRFDEAVVVIYRTQ